jgi:hypothetical protein
MKLRNIIKDKEINSCIKETKEHINLVAEFMNKISKELIERTKLHDLSKLEEPELKYFTKYTPMLKQLTYGSKEYQQSLDQLKIALDHHYADNKHHPEHFENRNCWNEFNRFS